MSRATAEIRGTLRSGLTITATWSPVCLWFLHKIQSFTPLDIHFVQMQLFSVAVRSRSEQIKADSLSSISRAVPAETVGGRGGG